MQLLHKIEHLVLGWLKNVPHLPNNARKWLAKNIWWIVLIAAILGAIAAVFELLALFVTASLIDSPSNSYLLFGRVTPYTLAVDTISFVFGIVMTVLAAMAVNPLKALQKKGWVLSFMALLVYAFSIVVSAILTLNFFGFLFTIIFGAIFAAVGAYFLFEIHSCFNHDGKPAKKSTKKV